MRIAIRDDDTNFFTQPEELEACYKDVWTQVPPTLCVISQVKGDWKHWVHQIYKTRHETDWDAWARDNEVYPLANNPSLVQFLSQKIAEGTLDVGFHAKHHRNEDQVLPAGMSNNYVRGAEFFTSRDLTTLISTEVGHLNNLLHTNISVFTPPQNLLSQKGYRAVIQAGLNICGGGITMYKKERTAAGIANLCRQAMFKIKHRGVDYPFVLRFARHNEIVYHYPLQPTTEIKTLIRAFEHVRAFDGDFVLSTHYVEFNYPMTYNNKLTMKDVLHEFLDHVLKYPVQMMSLSQLLA